MRLVTAASLSFFVLASIALPAQSPTTPRTLKAHAASTAPKAAPKTETAAPRVAATPPMGWNSWNYFFGKVTDKDIRDSADQIVANGMKDAGYVYVNIDDTWEGKRDENGVLHTNEKFPDMKALADYVHSKGLKIGIYSGPGPKTCAGYEGSLGHEDQDAKMYADWGIDYLKYDLCSYIPEVMEKQAPNDKAAQMRLMHAAYDKMAKALKATGRPIVFSLCQYGWDAVWEWAPALGGNLWRTTGDIQPNWNSMYTILSQQEGLEKYAGPGHWNDPDMLEVGNGRLSLGENRVHFSMWSMLSAPLLAGNDLPHMKPEIRDILTNRDVIAIDQDKLGRQASRVYSEGEVDVWVKHLSGGAMAIAVVNAGSDRYSTHPFHLNLARLGVHGPVKGKNLWTGKEMELKDNMPIEIPGHDVLLVRVAGAAK
ncbi:MAG TPA: glycoside hydrolase family 27 protein [Terracidiphilus sp.]|nr:glycoside hydrolase family 27 protein [Terracidiphilus sp.]